MDITETITLIISTSIAATDAGNLIFQQVWHPLDVLVVLDNITELTNREYSHK